MHTHVDTHNFCDKNNFVNFLFLIIFPGEIEEKDFVDEIINLPVDSVHKLLKFQILPDIMREKIYHGLPEVIYISLHTLIVSIRS